MEQGRDSDGSLGTRRRGRALDFGRPVFNLKRFLSLFSIHLLTRALVAALGGCKFPDGNLCRTGPGPVCAVSLGFRALW